MSDGGIIILIRWFLRPLEGQNSLQIDAVLHKEAVLSGLVAMRQAQRESEAAAETSAPGATTEDYVPSTSEAPPAPAPRRPWWKRGR